MGKITKSSIRSHHSIGVEVSTAGIRHKYAPAGYHGVEIIEETVF